MLRREFLALTVALPWLGQPVMAKPAWQPIYPDLGPTSGDELRKIKANLKAMASGSSDISREVEEGRRWLAGVEVVQPPAAQWLTLDGGPRLRILTPPRVKGAYLYIHGGGWCMGSALSGEKQMWRLAQALELAVVTVDYRLAPEHPCPAAVDDCLAAAAWLGQQYSDVPRFLGGGSAGSHLAALTLLAHRDLFQRVVLWYGAYDLTRPYHGLDVDHPDLTPGMLSRCRQRFLGDADARAISPLFADLTQLPPALFLAGDDDILFPDSLKMARAYAAAGNFSELVVYRGASHGFDGFPTLATQDALNRVDQFLAVS